VVTQANAEQRAWFFYDWANSAYITTVATVLVAPYLTSVAERAACGHVGTIAQPCREHLSVFGLSISAGSLVFYVITASTLLSAFVLPFVGAVADRVRSRRLLMCRLAWSGALVTALLFLVTGSNWQLGCLLLLVSNILYGASLVVYDALLIDVAGPDDRDRISSRGWAFGYLGGGLLLAFNLAFVTLRPFGVSTELAVRISMLSAALWWAIWTLIPYRGIVDRPPSAATVSGTLAQRSFGQLWRTLRELRNYPQTLLVLLAYMIYNDGIQTVIYSASVFGAKELGFVLGGTQALSRSFYSQFIPRGREAEYFSLYQACERGTSWLGTLVFGVVHQATGSYRPALLALIAFFVVGGLLLWRVDARRGIAEAGNPVPQVV
jgi:UMF1 family MFS transporter